MGKFEISLLKVYRTAHSDSQKCTVEELGKRKQARG